MTNIVHPLRKLEVRVFFNEAWGAKAFFGNGIEFPIVFSGANIDEATEKAEMFRKESLDKHETAYRNRRKAILEASAKKKRKKVNAGRT